MSESTSFYNPLSDIKKEYSAYFPRRSVFNKLLNVPPKYIYKLHNRRWLVIMQLCPDSVVYKGKQTGKLKNTNKVVTIKIIDKYNYKKEINEITLEEYTRDSNKQEDIIKLNYRINAYTTINNHTFYTAEMAKDYGLYYFESLEDAFANNVREVTSLTQTMTEKTATLKENINNKIKNTAYTLRKGADNVVSFFSS